MNRRILKIILIVVIIFTLFLPFINTCSAQSSIWDFSKDAQGVLGKMNEGTVTPGDIVILITSVTNFLLYIIVLVGILFLIVGGYQYMISAGNPDKAQKAKATITYSIIGIAVGGLAQSIIDFTRQRIVGVASITGLITSIINGALLFVGLVAILFLIVGGYQYMISAGNPENIQKAKKTITYSITGLVVVILSRTIANLVFNKVNGVALSTGLIENLIRSALGSVSVVAVLFLIIGGYQYITSTGNPETIQKAKTTILYSVTGLVITILSYAIIRFVLGIFGLSI